MFVAIKSISGHDYELGAKRIELRGGCYLNEISKDDFKALCDKYSCISEFIDKGYYIVSDTDDKKVSSKATAETIDHMKSEQDEKLKANEARTKAKIVRN